jgi:serine protease Do
MTIAKRLGTMVGVVLVLVGPVLLACGSPAPVNRTEQGRLQTGDSVLQQDNSLYDSYTFEAAEGMRITLTMTSTEFDTYLHLLDKDGNQIAQNDDNAAAGGTGAMAGKNSQIIHTAPYSGTYTVYANAYQQGNQGAYTLNIVTATP